MSRTRDKDDKEVAEPGPKTPAGRVEFDSRGNSVWRWARDLIEETSVLLKRLENKDLALEATNKVPVMGGADRGGKKTAGSEPKGVGKRPALQTEKDKGGGFDPYNSR